MTRRWVTVKEAAEYFKIRPKTMYSLAARGKIPGRDHAIKRFGRQIRINIELIESADLGGRNERRHG